MTVLRGVPGERSECRFWLSAPPNRYSRVSGCLGSADARGKRRKPRKGARVAGWQPQGVKRLEAPTELAGETSPLDGAQRRKNGGLL